MTDPFRNPPNRYDFEKSYSLPHTLNEYQNISKSKSNYSIKSEESVDNKQEFVQTHIDSNRELIVQLRNNIQLLFKGAGLVGQVVSFPFRVLRWQCQINSESLKYHIVPFTLFPVLYNLNYNGCVLLWKGCFSVAAYHGIKIICESIFSEVLSVEKNIEDVNKFDKLYGHVALKLLSNALTTPIFSAVIFESVQSGISYENLGLIDLLRETWNRITGYKYNYRTRLIPIWSLILPTSFYFVSCHFMSFVLEQMMHKSIVTFSRLFDEKRSLYGVDEIEEEVIEEPYLKSISQLSGQVGSLIALYPVENVINRLIVQGTRTIIDNTDNGIGVIPINTRYDGFWDCVQTINDTEGFGGFYKGFGALVLETAVMFMLLKAAKSVAIRIYDSEWTTKSDNNAIKNLMTTTEKYPNY